jgi:predicted membrane-bound dolichyl-phosphate-mannose-protein mannosyltransferase
MNVTVEKLNKIIIIFLIYTSVLGARFLFPFYSFSLHSRPCSKITVPVHILYIVRSEYSADLRKQTAADREPVA